MSKLKTLVKLLLFINTVGAEMINCTQCIGGNFKRKRWLFQSPTMPIEYGWMNTWENTDCHNGNYIIRECEYACLTIVVEKDFKMKRGYEYDGIMMDCSEYLIHKTPDLPQGIDFRFYNEDATYSAIRANHNLTYFFSTESVVGTDGILKLPIKSMPKTFNDKYMFNQLHLSTFIFMIFFSIVLLVFLCTFFWCCVFSVTAFCSGAYPKHSPQTKVYYQNTNGGNVLLMTENGVNVSKNRIFPGMDPERSINSVPEIEFNENELEMLQKAEEVTEIEYEPADSLPEKNEVFVFVENENRSIISAPEMEPENGDENEELLEKNEVENESVGSEKNDVVIFVESDNEKMEGTPV